MIVFRGSHEGWTSMDSQLRVLIYGRLTDPHLLPPSYELFDISLRRKPSRRVATSYSKIGQRRPRHLWNITGAVNDRYQHWHTLAAMFTLP
jgi:hypothetical protein